MKKLHNKVNKEELKQKMLESNVERTTLSFYKYAHIKDAEKFRNELYQTLEAIEVYGRIYVSDEGVNGQLSVPTVNLEEFKTRLYAVEFLDKVRLNIAIDDDGKSFYVLKIKTRQKIVADGLNDDTFDVTNRGVHLSAKGFNEITDDPNTIVIDMRNHYETEVGHFKNAVLPDADTFREALPKVEKMLEADKNKNIVMYCTGGIRCEKASAYYKHKGFKNVFQLDGGIIEYARQVEQLGLKNKFIGKTLSSMIEWANEFLKISSPIVTNVESLATHILIVPTMLVIFYLSNVTSVRRNSKTVVLKNVLTLSNYHSKSRRKRKKQPFLMEQNMEKDGTKHITRIMNFK